MDGLDRDQAMSNGRTPERRARQEALILNWKPWERSRGPQTERGKDPRIAGTQRVVGFHGHFHAADHVRSHGMAATLGN
jgi:hypothetical protein